MENILGTVKLSKASSLALMVNCESIHAALIVTMKNVRSVMLFLGKVWQEKDRIWQKAMNLMASDGEGRSRLLTLPSEPGLWLVLSWNRDLSWHQKRCGKTQPCWTECGWGEPGLPWMMWSIEITTGAIGDAVTELFGILVQAVNLKIFSASLPEIPAQRLHDDERLSPDLLHPEQQEQQGRRHDDWPRPARCRSESRQCHHQQRRTDFHLVILVCLDEDKHWLT